MKRKRIYKRLSLACVIIGVLLSNVMCAVVGLEYSAMLCGVDHKGYSAPASVAFLYAIPFCAGILCCAVLAFLFHGRAKRDAQS